MMRRVHLPAMISAVWQTGHVAFDSMVLALPSGTEVLLPLAYQR
jgi:hypothetical protein